MPIKYTSVPWFFIPKFSLESKVLLWAEMRSMASFFTLAHGCPSDSFVWQYEKSIIKEIGLSQQGLDTYIRYHGEIEDRHEDLLMMLAHSLTSSRQKKYCRDVLNTMALHISNQVQDSTVTRMLNNYIDDQIDDVLA